MKKYEKVTAKDACNSNSFKPNLSNVFSWKLFRVDNTRDLGYLTVLLQNLNGYSLGGAYLRIIFKCHFLHVAATWHLSLARLSTWWRKPNAGNDWSFCRFPNVRVEQEFSLEMVAPSFSNSQGTFPKNSLHQAEICIIFQGKMEHLATRCSPGINVNVHIVDYTYSNDIYLCTCLSSAWF